MTHKKLWIILLSLLLIAVAAVLVGSGVFAGNRIVASTPDYTTTTEDLQNLEPIADETTPLAGPAQPAQPIAVASTVVRTNAPAQTEPAATPIDLGIVTEPVVEEPVVEEPVVEEPTPGEPVEEEPVVEEPVVVSTTASRMLERANALIAQFNACTNSAEKRTLLGITNSNFSNDSFRHKILTDMGGSWEQLETDVQDAMAYEPSKALYVQVYIAGKSTDYEPVVYTTQFSDLSGSQWSTNLVYDDDTATWMEYTKKHDYNDSRVGYSLAKLNGQEGAWDTLKDTMETSDLWQPVDVAPEAGEPAEAPVVVAEG